MLNELFTCHCTCFVVFRYCSDKQLIITFLFREVFARTGPLTQGIEVDLSKALNMIDCVILSLIEMPFGIF